jgi:prepilin signal peptidase PulO-like enzyme (type II secretory pathway)
MNAVPRPVAIGVLVALLTVGIVAPRPWAGVAFLVVSAFIGWLLFLTWQRLTLPERLMRAAVLVLALAVAVVRIVPGS